MDEARHPSALIGDIYDAALDPALWVGVLAKCALFGRQADLVKLVAGFANPLVA